MFYDADKYKDNPPDSWADFFNSKEFPGKRAVDGRPTPLSGTLEAALLADGVASDDLYPIDTDRALKTYDKIKDDLITWETGAQQTQMAEAGEADMVFGWSGRSRVVPSRLTTRWPRQNAPAVSLAGQRTGHRLEQQP